MDGIPLSWIQDAVKASFSSSKPYSGLQGPDIGNPDDPGKDPRFRPLVEAVLFSRLLLSSYNVVLICVLMAFTGWQWGEKIALARKRQSLSRTAKDDDRREMETRIEEEEAWSSSSSTIEGTSTPPDMAQKTADENSPLFPTRSRRRTLGVWKPYYVLKSWLQYQPAPIPIINKRLPPNSVSLLVLSYLALNLFYNFFRMPLNMRYLFVFADRCGLLFATNLPLLYLLSAKTQPIKFLTGYSYESLNIFHRRVGELLCLEAFVHFLGMMFVWYGLLRHLGFTLARFLFNNLVAWGLGAFISFEVLYFTSLGSFRQRCYEIFLALHIFLQTAGLILLWVHYKTARPYVGISLAIFLIDRLVFRLWLKSTSHPASLAIFDDDETMLVSSNWDITERPSGWAPQSMRHGWAPNDHVFLTIPSLSNKHILQAHPFTIFSAAPTGSSNSGTNSDHAWFSLLIRTQHQSGFTRTLLKYARSHTKTRIRLDGPYGSSHALDVLCSSENAIVVAGGSGIAVAYPLLWALLNPNPDTESGTSSTRGQKVKLLWITHAADHRVWIPEAKMAELEEWGLEVLIPPPTSMAGRPDVRAALRTWITNESTGVVVSGPDGLVRDVRNTCAALIREGRDVSVQVEKFGW